MRRAPALGGLLRLFGCGRWAGRHLFERRHSRRSRRPAPARRPRPGMASHAPAASLTRPPCRGCGTPCVPARTDAGDCGGGSHAKAARGVRERVPPAREGRRSQPHRVCLDAGASTVAPLSRSCTRVTTAGVLALGVCPPSVHILLPARHRAQNDVKTCSLPPGCCPLPVTPSSRTTPRVTSRTPVKPATTRSNTRPVVD